MTTVSPEGSEQSQAATELSRLHREIGARSCDATADIRLSNIALAGKEHYHSADPAQAQIVDRALSDLKKLLRLEGIIPAEETSDSSPMVNRIVGDFLENPHFAQGYDLAQQLVKALKPYIAGTTSSFIDIQGRTEITGRFFDYNAVISKFAEDLRGLSLLFYITGELVNSFSADQFSQKGIQFGFLVFSHATVLNTMPHLNQLISLKAVVK